MGQWIATQLAAAQLLFQDTDSETDARQRSDSDASLTAIAMAVSDLDVDGQLDAHGTALDQELDDMEFAQAIAELDWGNFHLSEKELTAITTPTGEINYNHPGGGLARTGGRSLCGPGG